MLYLYYTRYFILFSLCTLALSNVTNAQFFDTFEDGNLTENPTWQGDLQNFTITSGNELRLDAPAAGSSLLYTSIEKFDSIAWNFYFRMEFDPSGTNKLRIYLYNEGNDFSTSDALFLEMGENGSLDDITVFERKNNILKNLGKAAGGNLALNPAEARVYVTFQSPGTWQVFADYSKGNVLVPILSFESTFSATENLNFGIECTYTSTRTTLFYFDDVGVDRLEEDNTPPLVSSLNIIDDNTLNVGFTKLIDPGTLIDPSNFSVNNGISNPANIQILNPSTAQLNFGTSFENGQEYTLTISGIQDTLGNAIADTNLIFSYLVAEIPEYGDIIISEIMADPNPPINLPDAEYIEIHNRSNKILNLKDLVLLRGSTTYPIPEHFILPGEYYMLCRIAELDLFLSVENKIGMNTFPAITNGGDELFLLNSNGDCVYRTTFSISDYGSSAKSDGGWSLELKYPESPCFSSSWSASVNNNGGTPGMPNSLPIISAPVEKIIQSFSLDDNSVTIRINQLLDMGDITNMLNWNITPSLEILGIDYFPCSSEADEIILFTDTFQEDVAYDITFRGIIKDCTGDELIVDEIISFVKPQLPQIGDLVINEILHHPKSGGSSYIEIYNQSDKFLRTGDLGLKNNSDQIIRINTDIIIPPAGFITISADRTNTLETYQVENPDWLIENSLPSLPNTSGTVVLLGFLPGDDVLRLDSLSYDESWHSGLLKEIAGISLERVEYQGASTSSDNWYSAAWNNGGGTPTAKNSQFRDAKNPTDGLISLEPKVFSPDGDGYNDFVTITLNTEGNYNLTVKIYDLQGREVRTLINNQIGGSSDKIIWDGSDDNGNHAVIGSYIIYIEGVDPSGSVIREKLSCVLAGNFN